MNIHFETNSFILKCEESKRTQFNDMFIHFLDGQMKNFPQVHFGKIF